MDHASGGAVCACSMVRSVTFQYHHRACWNPSVYKRSSWWLTDDLTGAMAETVLLARCVRQRAMCKQVRLGLSERMSCQGIYSETRWLLIHSFAQSIDETGAGL